MQTFKKEERLCSKIILGQLLEKGKSFNVFPFKVIYLETPHPGTQPAQVMISVPKKKIKSAVTRNKVKRVIREVYRRNKQPFYDFLLKNDNKMVLLLVYNGNQEINYKETEEKIKQLFNRFINSVGKE